MTDQKKEKCREVASHILNLAGIFGRDFACLHPAITAELLKREQREDKLVEFIKRHQNCMHDKSRDESTTLLKELGYE